VGQLTLFEETTRDPNAQSAPRREGWIGNAEAAAAFHRDLTQRMTAFLQEGLTLAEVADRLNAEGSTTRLGKPWDYRKVSSVVRKYGGLDRAVAERLRKANLSKGGTDRARRTAAHYRALLQQMLAWYREGASQEEIARRLNAEGSTTRLGKPWYPEAVSKVFRKYGGDEVREAREAGEGPRREKALAQAHAVRIGAREAYYEGLLPKMLAWCQEGLTAPAIARRLNDEVIKNSDGRPWSRQLVLAVLRRYGGGRYAPLARDGRRLGARARAQRAEDYYRPFVSSMTRWLHEGLTLREIARRLDEEGRRTFGGKRWTASTVQVLIKKYGSDEARSFAAAGRRAGARASAARAAGYYGPLVGRMAQWRLEGLSLAAVARRLNAEGSLNARGSPWTAPQVLKVLRKHGGDESRYTQYPEACQRHGGEVHARKARDYSEPFVPRILAGRREGLTFAEIADRLNAEEEMTVRGKPWTKRTVRHVLIRYAGDDKHPAPGSHDPVILGDEGESAWVLGTDGRYRAKALQSKARRRLVEELIRAGDDGLTTAQLKAYRIDRGTIGRMMEEDPDWAAVIYRPEQHGKHGWRFGPPKVCDQ
jgi:hypothetical protein